MQPSFVCKCQIKVLLNITEIIFSNYQSNFEICLYLVNVWVRKKCPYHGQSCLSEQRSMILNETIKKMVSKIFFLIITIPPMPSLVDISQTAKKIKLWWNNNCNDCLFVCNFTSHSRIFHSFGHVTIAGEGLQILPMLGTYGHWAVRVFLPLWYGASVYNGHLRGPLTLWSCHNL